ncbi:MAG: aspartate kinase [Sandaracinaceae bacterium]|nr:aspartate kinase [Sandaracinaceae bacterium]
MAVVVQKYGGSSVADVPKLERVAEKVVATRASGLDVVVVISAMGKTTDQLLALAHEVDASPPRRELDMLLTTGERVSMSLLSMAIQKRGCDAISFTGSQSGIMTNDRHFDARIIEVRPWRIEDELARGRVVIVAGYQGMSYRREITTLGRGGSDTTAIALAAALGADRAEIYSDVDGVYSADPRVVREATHLAELTYEQMQEMAEAGAKVLNSTAVEFAKRARIAIHARSTFDAGRETVVHESAGAEAPAVVGRADLATIRVAAEALGATLSHAGELGLGVRESALEGAHACLVVATSAPGWASHRRALEARGCSVEEGIGAVSVVAPELGAKPAWMAAAMDALARAEIPLLGAHTAPLRWTGRIEARRVDDAVRAVHDALGRMAER